MEFGQQRVADPVLGRIAAEITHVMRAVGVNRSANSLAFNRSYFEMSDDWLALCFSYKLDGPVPLYQLQTLEQIPADRQDHVEIYRGLEGFSGQVITQAGQPAHSAVFLNSDINGSHEACHTLIHEAVHMNSYNSQGFQAGGFISEWQSPPLQGDGNGPPAGMSERFYTVLDEGATEFFARIVTAGLRHEASAPIVARQSGVPVYEYPLAAVCDLATELGLGAIAKAFFNGDRTLQNLLRQRSDNADNDSRYGRRYFELLSGLSIFSGNYAPPNPDSFPDTEEGQRDFSAANSTYHWNGGRVDELLALGVHLPQAQQLIASISGHAYNDPAVSVWQRQVKDVRDHFVHPAILAIGGVAAAYTAYRVARGGGS